MEYSMEQKIRAFLAQRFLVAFDDVITPESDLFQLGFIDSYSYIELVQYIETEFSLTFTDDEIMSNVMVSLAGITDLVRRKRAGQL
jgi:acyl carrier protein